MARVRLEFRDVRKSFRLRNRADSLRDAVSRAFGRLAGRESAGPRRFTALDGVSFRVAEGEVVGLIGINGAGKSTSLRLAAGVYPADGGTVAVDGRVSPMIELFAGFHPDLSGRENVFLAGALLGLRRREVAALFDEIVDFAAIGEFLEAPVRTYSSGMQVRLGFAVASTVPAEILLVDEVLAVGDMEFQAKCLSRMKERRASGLAVMFVSHNMGVVEQFCDRVILLDAGRVALEGSPAEVIDEYRRRVLARVPSLQAVPSGRGRRGTGEVLIHAVEVRGGEGEPPRSGRPLRVELRWEAKAPVAGPVFGVAVHSPDGVILGEVRSADRGRQEEVLHGRGACLLDLPDLPLLPGPYLLTVYVRDSSGMIDLDYQGKAHSLVVEGVRGPSESGSVRLRPRWSQAPRGGGAGGP